MNGRDMVRVLIVDDHEGFRQTLRETLAREPDFQVVGDESNGADAIRRVRALRPHGLDLVLMDIDMPIMNGLNATAEIVKSDPDLPVIILTVSSAERDLFAGVRAGAIGFLTKGLAPASLLRSLRDFCRNGSLPMSRAMAGKALAHLQRLQGSHAAQESSPTGLLTWREREVLRRIRSGARDREIAEGMLVAETTIKTHVRHILRKLGARNRAEAAAAFGTVESR